MADIFVCRSIIYPKRRQQVRHDRNGYLGGGRLQLKDVTAALAFIESAGQGRNLDFSSTACIKDNLRRDQDGGGVVLVERETGGRHGC